MFAKKPTAARWKDDPGFKEYSAFMAKYMSPTEFIDFLARSLHFGVAAMLIPVLKQCGDDLSREYRCVVLRSGYVLLATR